MVSVGQDMTDFEKLSLGELDGKRYAKRKGGNIVLGFFTGLIGTGIVYLTSSQYPSLEAMNGPNKEQKRKKRFLKKKRTKNGQKKLFDNFLARTNRQC